MTINSLLEPVMETDMQQFCVEIMKRLDSQRRNEHLCDVILEVGRSGDNQDRLKAHKNVLCAASPFFYNALNIEMKEKKEGVIRLKDTSKALMEEVLQYLYTGHVDINDKNAYELMAVADYLLIPSLKLVSSKFIEQTLCVSNCIMAYYSSVKYQCAELQEGARSFIFANFVAVTQTEDFLNLSVGQVEEWILSDEIVVKGEEDVFTAILKWTEKSVEREESFLKLFRHVRFIYVSRNYIFTDILQHELVKSKKKCLDLVLGAMKEASDGTEACFLNQSPRSCLRAYEDAIFACGGANGNKMLCYLPSENKWYKMAGPQFNRNACAAALSACQGKLYVVGGNAKHFAVERYDPLLNSWSPIKSFKQTISFAAAVTLQGYLYVIGGKDNNHMHLSKVQKYNPDTNLWQEVSPLSCPRSGVCAVADSSNIYAIGGLDSSGVDCNMVEKFDPEFNVWTRVASMQAKRKHAAGVSLQSRIFVFGGTSNVCPSEMYDKVANVWTNIASTIAPIHAASGICFKGKIFVLGGFGSIEHMPNKRLLWVYDVDKNVWRPYHMVSFGALLYRLSAVRILREVLDSCEEVQDLTMI